ncbi:hypothetical protein SAMD00019534_012400 [Acytostelium subglobosum LB1]|uniref:hypothetical protein n=1 Tax=Acytostelium subglobosum LB1 TaxID=1410327 RepID=UPI000644C8C6|nr:hypothetical protein SAMD00019534_012400 [Acytostelium subglobosum LB1]GAM18065.1 hypothetical protein SAMD00019534_012400 [Acytostelium subglobosum LB1]|eukprot:XP_012758661.1 hypothetical protein SAMD00019534_012400 [Acytostelium subglobosum LB1]
MSNTRQQSVLVLGGGGYIGQEVAIAFVHAGYKVYALVRSNKKDDILLRNEITPVHAKDVLDFAAWEELGNDVDVIVEAVEFGPDTVTLVFDQLKRLHDRRSSGNGGRPLTIIYTSGTWVYGQMDDPQHHVITEDTGYDRCAPLEYMRRDIECKYRTINAIIIEATLVYGSAGSLSADYFQAVTSGTFALFITEQQQLTFVHVYDLAQIYVLAAQHNDVACGQTFICGAYHHRVVDVIEAIAKAAGVPMKPINYLPPASDDLFQQCLVISQCVSSSKAERMLGWRPVQPSIIQDAPRYLQTWRHFQ